MIDVRDMQGATVLAAELAAEVEEDLSEFLRRTYGVSLQEYVGGGAPGGGAAAVPGAAGGGDAQLHDSSDDGDVDMGTASPEAGGRAVRCGAQTTMHAAGSIAGCAVGGSSWASDLMAVEAIAASKQRPRRGDTGAGPSSAMLAASSVPGASGGGGEGVADEGAAGDDREGEDDEDEEDWHNAEAVDDEQTLEEEEALASAEGTVRAVCGTCAMLCRFNMWSFSGARRER